MDNLLRALAFYFILILVFRISGKRTLQDLTLFEFVLLLIISEASDNALLSDDYSLTNGVLIIMLYLFTSVMLSLLKDRFSFIDKTLDSTALLLVADGQPIHERLKKSRISEDDIMERARELHGLERMDQVKYAVLEKDGKINIIPYS